MCLYSSVVFGVAEGNDTKTAGNDTTRRGNDTSGGWRCTVPCILAETIEMTHHAPEITQHAPEHDTAGSR